ncbi:ABC transporter permease [Allofustis seminis]|uniref:ABC transporter permease n=1 Tax=Allofustis seminis TaxID=166939 RepID=UPI0003608C15|nr:ABC transporter permease [Allofustis seminis]
MNPTELLKSALTTMRMNKRRTFLTMFGIVIGIASVITILSLGNGFRQQTLTDLAKDEGGRRNQEFFFSSNDFTTDPAKLDPFSHTNLSDIKNMDGVDEVKIGESHSRGPDDITYATLTSKNVTEMYSGKTVESSSETIIAGRNLTSLDNEGKRRYVLIGSNVSEKLFPGKEAEEVLHHAVNIDKNSYTIVGIYQAQNKADEENNPFMMFMEEAGFYVPAAAFKLGQIEDDWKASIVVYFKDDADMKKVSKDIQKYLTENGKEKNTGTYSYFDMSEMMEEIGKQLNNITYFITAIAGISLFIAGVGVMNMMYISVSERTKEIGIRRALGATAQSIQGQFLLEGVTISLIGGLVGYSLGIGLSYAIAAVLPFPAAPDVMTALFAVGVSTFIGIIFSVFPAKSAASKNVVEILR